jgi:hypothetical protein
MTKVIENNLLHGLRIKTPASFIKDKNLIMNEAGAVFI